MKRFSWVSSTLLPVLAAFICDIFFSYETNDQVLLIFIGSLLLLTNISVFIHARAINRYFPLFLCICSSILIMTGQFIYASYWHVSFGICGLFIAAALNLIETPD